MTAARKPKIPQRSSVSGAWPEKSVLPAAAEKTGGQEQARQCARGFRHSSPSEGGAPVEGELAFSRNESAGKSRAVVREAGEDAGEIGGKTCSTEDIGPCLVGVPEGVTEGFARAENDVENGRAAHRRGIVIDHLVIATLIGTCLVSNG